MPLEGSLWHWLGATLSVPALLAGTGTAVSAPHDIAFGLLLTPVLLHLARQLLAYCVGQVAYRLYVHPLSAFPGPRLAAATDLWWAYASVTGRYPWIIEELLNRYGDVVRIAPNELVFGSPQAAKDIYLPHFKNMELFTKPGHNRFDTADRGITTEPNPAKHRDIAKKLSPAFSTRNLRAKESIIQKHVNRFIEKVQQIGSRTEGIDLLVWTDWLALDLSAEMTYGQDWGHVRDAKSSVFLDTISKLNLYAVTTNITTKFRIFTPLKYLLIPPSVWLSMPRLVRSNRQTVNARINQSGQVRHLDYFEQLVPADQPPPIDEKTISHVQNVAAQLLLASWQPVSHQLYSIIFELLQGPQGSRAYIALRDEVRSAFTSSNDINTNTTARLEYLSGCIHESLRLHLNVSHGQPRVSPGAKVEGKFIPKGVICQHAHFAAARNPRFFAEPLTFYPERWLRSGHPLFDDKFQHDDLKASMPFSQGPRACMGTSIALAIIRVFIAKLIWHFDLEQVAGQEKIFLDKDYRYYVFWERPPFRARFRAVQAVNRGEKTSV